MIKRSFSEIFAEHAGYISDKWENYLAIYESELRAMVDEREPLRLLVIGAQNGGSLQIWDQYLPTGSSIVGIDVDPKCASLEFPDSIRVLVGDATNKRFLDEQLGDAEFDIIVDDGSHRSSEVISSIGALLPRLSHRGKYFIEDLHASYWQNYGGGFRRANSRSNI